VRVLLDTHTFLWWNTNDPQLSTLARSTIADCENEVFLSAASAWEIAIKAARGRLTLPEPPERYVTERMARHRIQALPIHLSHALHIHTLPLLHTDPFDRLLVAQSQLERMPLLTTDAEIVRYGVQVIW
jgi:PIN domain nuclease of toxin-antitoxin system